jgi:hypothetical protein
MYTFNGNILTVDNKWLGDGSRPLPPPTGDIPKVRLKFQQNVDPREIQRFIQHDPALEFELISAADNIWDIGTPINDIVGYADWGDLCQGVTEVTEFVGVYRSDLVFNMARMFISCTNLVSAGNVILDVSGIHDYTGGLMTVTGTIDSMFYGCESLVSAPDVSGHAITNANIKNLENMFHDCHSLKDVPQCWTVNGCENFDNMFNGCLSLESVWELRLPNAKNIDRMFADCRVLEYVGDAFQIGPVITCARAFYNCYIVHNAYGLYQTLSPKPTITDHRNTFTNAGINAPGEEWMYDLIADDWK